MDLVFFKKNGYCIIKNTFTKQEINDLRKEIVSYIKNKKNNMLICGKGISLVDFINNIKFPIASKLVSHKTILDNLNIIFGKDEYRFCSHNDIGVNRSPPFHRDILNGSYRKFQTHDPWENVEGEVHQIVKVAIYLQDHVNNNFSLTCVPGSHIDQRLKENKAITLHPQLGDLIIFDQRILHKGNPKPILNTEDRILISLGYGRNNIFTDEFEQGTTARQRDQLTNKK